MENKWWEYYAVRYFVGTVVGAAIVSYLNAKTGSPFEGMLAFVGESKEATFLGVGLVASLGFAFCYIASAPVLVLHAVRAHLRYPAVQKSLFPFVVYLFLSFLFLLAIESNFFPTLYLHFSLLIPFLIVGFQLVLLFSASTTKLAVIEDFYRALAEQRAKIMPEKDKPATAGLEYVTSYRHLREHGNAFLIVFLEGLLAYVLVNICDIKIASIVLALWVLPGATVWLIGTVLESRFVSRTVP